MAMWDYKGSLHVHSTYSDGDAAVPEILDAAREAGLDFVVLADHDTLAARDDGWERWHNGVLLMVGIEVRAGCHHCMALGMDGVDGFPHDTVADGLASIKRHGGLSIVVHPHAVHKPFFRLRVPGWTDWHLDSVDALEIWPYMHDWIRQLRPWNFLSHVRHPDRWVSGPEAPILREWDAMGRRRRVVGLGSLDNHARRFPFRRRGPALFELLPHAYAFRTVRTHVLSEEPFTGQPQPDLARLHALLAQGRCYVSYDLDADATGFRFEGERDGAPIGMGDEVAAGAPVGFRAVCPADADLRLLRDGQPIAAARGREVAARDAIPGVYRVEAFLEGRPWIFSNPIYLRGG